MALSGPGDPSLSQYISAYADPSNSAASGSTPSTVSGVTGLPSSGSATPTASTLAPTVSGANSLVNSLVAQGAGQAVPRSTQSLSRSTGSPTPTTPSTTPSTPTATPTPPYTPPAPTTPSNPYTPVSRTIPTGPMITLPNPQTNTTTLGGQPFPSTTPYPPGSVNALLQNIQQPTTTAGTVAQWQTQFPGIDPTYAALLASHGLTPGAQGSGVTDWQYWSPLFAQDPTEFTSRWNQTFSGGSGSSPSSDAISQLFGLLSGPSSVNTGTFSDPETKNFLDFLNSYATQLTTPKTDPALTAMTNASTTLANQLSTPWINPQTQTVNDTLNKILGTVTGPTPFSSGQFAALKAQTFDQNEMDRQNALQQETARLASLGYGPNSPIVAENLRQINAQYDSNREQLTANLATQGIAQANTNQTTAQNVVNELSTFAQQNQAYNESRAATGVSLLEGVNQADQAQRAENQANLDKALSLLYLPISIGDTRFQEALQAVGLGGSVDPNAIFSTLTGAANSSAAQALATQQNNAAFWEAFANSLIKAIPSTPSTPSTSSTG